MRVLAFLIVVLATSAAQAQHRPSHSSTTKFYGQTGKPEGRAVHQGNTTKFYGQTGKPEGRAVHQGNTTKFYGQTGKPHGSAKTR